MGVDDEPIPASRRKKRIVVNEPVVGGVGNRNRNTSDIKRPITSKTDLPAYFLNALMCPESYKNPEAIRVNFKSEHIILLCDMAE